MKRYIKINRHDNVAVALDALIEGETLCFEDDKQVVLKEAIGQGHKFAIKNILKEEDVMKYGAPIGHASKDIMEGEWVHTHNVKTNLEGIIAYSYDKQDTVLKADDIPSTFKGYARENGDVGIRNELWIIPTVGCVNGVGEAILKQFTRRYPEFACDGIEIFKHNYGCSQLGNDHMNTQKILADMIDHPNCGGALVLGLGCENNTIESLKTFIKHKDPKRIAFLTTQEVSDEIEAGVEALKSLSEVMSRDVRTEISVEKLKIGLKCGGSDGLSGITANPLLGAFSDALIVKGGTTVLTEVPEMFGAETLLMNRCIDEKTFNKTVKLINDFKTYFMAYDQPVYENPSPGNKKGGISTLEDKSLGCIQKGGHADVVDVLAYGERLESHGLNLLNAPGNDLVASTALAASGCHMVLFTTGRGTPFGTFVPTVKVSSNTALSEMKANWIDFNAGVLVEDHTMSETLSNFSKKIIAIASGEHSKNEKNGYKEIAIFKTGVTL
jgi:altronate hydrolase